jgi:lysine-specific demethylase/histidyl-hydroxylase NO66
MEFGELVAPLTPEEFLAQWLGQKPLHISAPPESRRQALLPWARFNELLAVQRHWSRENIDLMRNGQALSPDLYMEEIVAQEGPIERASPAKLDVYLSLGASLVARSVQQIAPDIRRVTAMLGERFGARITANVYCSFAGVAALARHFDTHDVFAVQTEGEKTWRIYDHPADNPVRDTVRRRTPGEAEPERRILLEARMRPGDLLYIPRGYFHDALADAGESLHLTFSVESPTGADLLRLLRQVALQDPLFRADLPHEREGEGAALREHLGLLAERLAELVRSSLFSDELSTMRCKLTRSPYLQALPSRPALRFFVTARRGAAVVSRDSGAFLVSGGAEEEMPLGPLREEAEWILAHPMFSAEELAANFPHRAPDQVDRLIDRLVLAGILRPVERPA